MQVGGCRGSVPLPGCKLKLPSWPRPQRDMDGVGAAAASARPLSGRAPHPLPSCWAVLPPSMGEEAVGTACQVPCAAWKLGDCIYQHVPRTVGEAAC